MGKRLQFGAYITLKAIGDSSHGATYVAMHQTTGKMVALRILTVTHRNVAQAIDDCLKVLDDIANLKLPNAVQILDFGTEGDVLYIAMTVLNGGTLHQRIEQRIVNATPPQFPSPDDILKTTERLAVALDALHQMGMVHGQIQPHNILFNEQGEAFLTDIGLTRIFKIVYNLDSTNSFNMTRYSPPELWSGERPNSATDQYALACIVYQLFTGRVPFDGKSIFQLMEAHKNNVAVPPHYIRKGLPSDLETVFWQALAKMPEHRYLNLRSFYLDLQRCFADYPSQTTDFFTFLLT
ncbi:MAG: serine/threonine-protein kinase [Chloroflexota bacterium]